MVDAQTKNYKIPLSTAAYLSRYSDQSIGRSTFMGTGMGTDLRRDLRGGVCSGLLILGLAFAAPFAVVPQRACAAGADSPSDVAKEKYGRALKAYGSSHYAEALLLLEEVRRLHSGPSALLLLGHCYSKLGRPASAVDAYRDAERSAAAQIANGKDQSGSLKETRGSALEHMADLELRLPYVTIAVPSDLPADFSLLLDGRPVPSEKWGTALPVDPGGHEVAATGSRMTPYKQSIMVVEGEKKRIEVSPEREASARVVVQLPDRVTPTETSMLVDGQKQAIAGPTTNLLLAPGPHTVIVQAPYRRTFRYSGGVGNGESVVLRPSLVRATPRWATYVVGGLALATIGMAIGLSSYAKNLDDVNRPSAGLPSSSATEITDKERTRDNIQIMAKASIGLFVIGAASAAATAGLAFTADWK